MSTTISGVKSKVCFPGNVSNISKVQEAQNMDSFSKVFDKTQEFEGENKTESGINPKDSSKVQKYEELQKGKTPENLKQQSKVKEADELPETVEEIVNRVVENIAEVFEVTVEEVEAVLETLGLTALDLLKSENLTNVVLALNPGCDAMTLMMNEELFSNLKGLMNFVQELKGQIAQEFHLSEEELDVVLNDLKEKLQIVNPEETQNTELQAKTEVLSDVTVEAAAENMSVADQGKETNAVYKQETEKDETKAVEPVNHQTEKVVYKAEDSQTAQKDSSQTKEDSSNAAAQNFSQNFVNQLAEAVENANQTVTSYGVRGQDIIQQITEQIRVHVTQDTTEMELQLHPASLGNVKVQIASTGGVLTAVFTTENEAVKSALESQMVQLKENFVQQGLKVESIEVNVSAQGFERSLDQHEQEQNRFEENRSKKGNRRIRLNGMEDSGDILMEDMSGDDRIVADMMIRNGNTVDYMV